MFLLSGVLFTSTNKTLTIADPTLAKFVGVVVSFLPLLHNTWGN